MDTEHLQETLDHLSMAISGLVEDHYDMMISIRPPSLHDQLTWARTLQQFGRDTDVLCEACAVLIRRIHDGARPLA